MKEMWALLVFRVALTGGAQNFTSKYTILRAYSFARGGKPLSTAWHVHGDE